MKKSAIFRTLFFMIPALLLSSVTVSCYGSWGLWDSDNDVDLRTETMTDVTVDFSNKLVALSQPALSALGAGANEKYTVLILTDLHYGVTKTGVPEDKLFAWLEKLKITDPAKMPKFGIGIGDLVEYGKQEEYDMYLEFCNKLKTRFDIQMINVPGNHDIYHSNWPNWKKNCYPYTSFYSFKTNGISWYALDTASGTLGMPQYKKIKAIMEADPNPKIVYTHYPLVQYYQAFGFSDTTERNLLIDLFAKNNVICVFGGHIHYYYHEYLGYEQYCLPSFRERKTWEILTVDEAANTATIEVYQ